MLIREIERCVWLKKVEVNLMASATKGLFGFAVLLTWAHLKTHVSTMRVRLRSHIKMYMLYTCMHVAICMSMTRWTSRPLVRSGRAPSPKREATKQPVEYTYPWIISLSNGSSLNLSIKCSIIGQSITAPKSFVCFMLIQVPWPDQKTQYYGQICFVFAIVFLINLI